VTRQSRRNSSRQSRHTENLGGMSERYVDAIPGVTLADLPPALTVARSRVTFLSRLPSPSVFSPRACPGITRRHLPLDGHAARRVLAAQFYQLKLWWNVLKQVDPLKDILDSALFGGYPLEVRRR
jgi:hypothetical protein